MIDAKLTDISRKETLQYLGYRGGTLPDGLEEDLTRCRSRILEKAKPRAVWRVFPYEGSGRLTGTELVLPGQDVPELLETCNRVILFCATLGREAEQLLRREQLRDMAGAVVLDASASAAIENVCDNLCAAFEAEFGPVFLTDRFSPGYGDLPLALQREFCTLLNVERRIGVTLSESGLMIPQKTVTALVGLSSVPQPHRHRGCPSCQLFETCTLRKDGFTCGKV